MVRFEIKIIFYKIKKTWNNFFTVAEWQFIVGWYFTIEKHLEWVFGKINILTKRPKQTGSKMMMFPLDRTKDKYRGGKIALRSQPLQLRNWM